MKLAEHELEEILKHDLALDKVKRHSGRKGINYMFCCPFHGENSPSAGIVMDGEGGIYGQCYACEERFSLPKLYGYVKGLEFHDAMSEIEEKFNVDFRSTFESEDKLRRYEDIEEAQEEESKRFELPRSKLAPYRSGKETHPYIFKRGYTKEIVKEAMMGWDRIRKRITIPVFHPDGVLAGIIGRAVLNEKTKSGKVNRKYKEVYGNQPKYFIYDNFPIGEVLYGSHEFYSEDNTAIIVEGTLDRQWLKQLGFTNVLSIIVAKMSMDKKTGYSTQAEILHQLGVKRVIFMHDNDKAGRVGKEVAYEILKDDFICFDTEYPEGQKDPEGMTKKQVDKMLKNKTRYGRKKLRRL